MKILSTPGETVTITTKELDQLRYLSAQLMLQEGKNPLVKLISATLETIHYRTTS